MVNTLFFLSLCIGSAILYRTGGAEGYNTKFRDLGCPLMAIIVLWHLLGFHWLYFLVFGLMFAALTTYYDTIFKKDNFFAHGAGIGLSTIPLLWCGVHWYSIVIYTVLSSVFIGVTRHTLKIDNKWKELITGFLIIILLLIYRR